MFQNRTMMHQELRKKHHAPQKYKRAKPYMTAKSVTPLSGRDKAIFKSLTCCLLYSVGSKIGNNLRGENLKGWERTVEADEQKRCDNLQALSW
jgi:hypothetical protein